MLLRDSSRVTQRRAYVSASPATSASSACSSVSEKHGNIAGKYMGNLWEIYGKYMGHMWKMWEISGKNMGNIWKIWNISEIIGKIWKHIWKIWKISGNIMKHMGSGKYMGKTMGIENEDCRLKIKSNAKSHRDLQKKIPFKGF